LQVSIHDTLLLLHRFSSIRFSAQPTRLDIPCKRVYSTSAIFGIKILPKILRFY